MKQAPLATGRRVHRADQVLVHDQYRAAQAEEQARADRALRRFTWENPGETVRSGQGLAQEAAHGRL